MIRKISSILIWDLYLVGIMMLCDAFFFDELKTFWNYFILAIVFAILLPIANHLDKKGWCSWKKVGNFFERKK